MVIDHENLAGAEFSGLDLLSFTSIGSRFESCLFESMSIEGANLGAGREQSEYVGCTFDGSQMRVPAGGFARFERCSFRDVDISHAFFFQVELVECVFSGRLHKVVFNGSVPAENRGWVGREHNEFQGNDFSEADLVDVAFRTGIDLSQQSLPGGPEYLYVAEATTVVPVVRQRVGHWAESDLRRRASVFAEALERTVGGGQCQLLVRPTDFYPSLGRDAVDSVMGLLREAQRG